MYYFLDGNWQEIVLNTIIFLFNVRKEDKKSVYIFSDKYSKIRKMNVGGNSSEF